MQDFYKELRNILAKKPKISPEKLNDYISETAMIGGFFMLLKGLYTIYPPAMWIIGGILLILLGFPARRRLK
jgi:hypothetical protein